MDKTYNKRKFDTDETVDDSKENATASFNLEQSIMSEHLSIFPTDQTNIYFLKNEVVIKYCFNGRLKVITSGAAEYMGGQTLFLQQS